MKTPETVVSSVQVDQLLDLADSVNSAVEYTVAFGIGVLLVGAGYQVIRSLKDKTPKSYDLQDSIVE